MAEGGASGFLVFFLITTIVTVIKFYVSGTSILSINIAYGILVVISQFVINLNLTKVLCYGTNFLLAFLTTIVPWVLLFGILNIMLVVFPGWLAPFSNTFGYGVALLAGANETIRGIFKDPSSLDDPKDADTKQMKESLAYIYADQSLLINQVTLENFETFWKKMRPLMNPSDADNPESMEKFRKLIQIKEAVSLYIWYILTGMVVTAISYNFILNAECAPSPEQSRHNIEEYQKTIEEEEKQQQEQNNIVYKGI